MIDRIEENDRVCYRLNGVPHRPNGPAFEWPNGDWSWSLYGKIHRYYGPAACNETIDKYHGGNSKFWVLHGEGVR
jgi:hypothetical protein